MTVLAALATGRWSPGRPLPAGTRVAFGGHLLDPRPVLAARARAAGLVPVEDVDATTGLVVANDALSDDDGVRPALSLRPPIVDEYAFAALLPTVAGARAPRHRAASG